MDGAQALVFKMLVLVIDTLAHSTWGAMPSWVKKLATSHWVADSTAESLNCISLVAG